MAFMLSIDGGGTKLIGILFDEKLNILGTGHAGGVNTTQTTIEDCRANVRACLDQVFASVHPELIDTVYVIFVGPFNVFEEELRGTVRVDRLIRNNESEAGLIAGDLKRTGMLALSGTGAGISYVKAEGRVAVGFLGPIFGDQGSGPWMGLQVVRAVSRALNGWGEPTILKDMICDTWHVSDIWGMVDTVQHATAPYRKLGELTRVLGLACERHDPIAEQIVRSAGHVLAIQTDSLIRKAAIGSEEQQITLCGGAWKTHPLMFETYKQEVRARYPEAKVNRPLFEHVCSGPICYLTEAGYSRENIRARMQTCFSNYIISKR